MWITLTREDIENHLSKDELDSFTTESLAVGQDDPSEALIEEITREVRGYVGGNPANTLGPAEHIPDELKRAALHLLRWGLINRLPGMAFFANEQRKNERDDALKLLRDTAAGRFAIAQPDVASDEVVNSARVDVATSRTKKATSTEMDGL